MGSQCCGTELNTYEIKLDKVEAVEAERQQRKGQPSQKIAIKLSEIPNKYKSDAELQKINRMVFKVAEYQRKFREPIRIKKPAQHQNRLQQPYYIPSLQMFYVGQWVFSEAFNQNVPGGIGRLYEDGVISEGVFKTYVIEAEQATDLIISEDRQEQLASNKLQNSGSKVDLRNQDGKIQKLLKTDRIKIANDYNFVVKLNGTGRVNSVEENNQDQIMLQGEFSQGQLNGKGTLKMITSQEQHQYNDSLKKKKKRKKSHEVSALQKVSQIDESKKNALDFDRTKSQKIIRKTDYYYSGFWKEGVKHGKGIQKVQYLYKQKTNEIEMEANINSQKSQKKTIFSQSFKYEGTFFQNSKHGKGSLTFMGIPKVEHQILRDLEKMENRMMNQGESIKAEVTSKLITRRQRQEFIQQKLDDLPQKFKARHIKLSMQRSLLFDVSFNIQRAHRTIFSENYVGDFVHGQMTGHGTYVWSNGKTYRGKWKQNKLCGKGEFYWPQQTYFQGEYLDDQRTGEGLMIWSLFKRYRGNWAFGMRHGYGESIQITENTEEMVIKGSIWDRDKVKRKLFEEVISIPGFNALLSKQFEDEGESLKELKPNQHLDNQHPAPQF